MGILSFVFSPRQVYVYGESGLKAFLRGLAFACGMRSGVLNSYKTSLSTVGFQGPLRNVFTLLPPFTDRWTEDPVGIGTARHPYVRLNDSSPSAGPHLLQARIVSEDVWLVAVLIVLGC